MPGNVLIRTDEQKPAAIERLVLGLRLQNM